MPNFSEGKSCVHSGFRVCKRGVHTPHQKVVVCTKAWLSAFIPDFRLSFVHSEKVSFNSAFGQVFPTIHTPYKEKKHINLNILNTYISGELA